MPRLYLVRHGKTDTTWDDRDPDPGLNDVGRAQAEAAAAKLAAKGPLPLVTSPLRRTRETANALERRWNVTATPDPRIGEITPPAKVSMPRTEWLKSVLHGCWSELGEPLERWRNQVLEAILGIVKDTVLVSHFVAINVAVGHALGDERVTCFRPENCSCTVLDLEGSKLQIVELGVEGVGKVV